MATLDNLTAALTQVGSDVTKAAGDVTAAIASLQATIAGLTAGEITQAQIDTLTGQAQAIDQAVVALDAGLPAPAPTPTSIPKA